MPTKKRELITVRVLVPHDHMARYTIAQLRNTPDLERRIAKGFLEEVDTEEQADE